jgi:ubiquitin-protein ligase
VSGGRLQVVDRKGDPPNEITIELRCKTAASTEYPAHHAERTEVRIQFPARYPFQEPLAEIKTRILHPNVYTSGRICFGTKWIPTEGLDLLVKRIGQIITFDPSVLNEQSPANRDAVNWYRSAKLKFPQAFPTDSLPFLSAGKQDKATVKWRDISAKPTQPGAKIIRCGRCSQQLRVPDRTGIEVHCPKCGNTFRQ